MAQLSADMNKYLEVQDGPAIVTQAPPTTGPPSRRSTDRTPSMAIQAEKADLKEAAQQSSTVILDLNLDGKVRWVSQSWEDVIGYVSPHQLCLRICTNLVTGLLVILYKANQCLIHFYTTKIHS